MSSDNRLLEFIQGDKVEKVDRANCIIYGAKALGEKSRNAPPNNNLYPKATREAAVPMLEGLAVGINHPPRSQSADTRPYQDLNGCLRRPRETGSGIRVDWHLNPKHPLTEQILWDAENNPANLAFSINAHATSRRRTPEGMVVEGIERFDTLDLVSRGATTNGLFESQRQPMKRRVSDLIESLKVSRPGYSRALKEMAESGLLGPETQVDEPAPEPEPAEPADHEEALKAGFKGAMNAVLEDDSMDMKAKLSKLKEIMQAQEKLMGGGKKEEAPAAPAEDTKESLKLRLRSRDLLMESRVSPNKVLLKALDGCRSEAEVKELIESARSIGGNIYNGARSSSPGPSPQDTARLAEAKAPDDPKALGKWLLSE